MNTARQPVQPPRAAGEVAGRSGPAVVDVVADAVVQEGVEVVFGVLGDGNLHLAVALVDRGVRWVSARHEAGAVAMADGWARRTGRTGVASVTHGPGLTNAATSLTAARLARTPLVLLAGDTPRTTRHHGQDIDQAPVAVSTGGGFVPLRVAATATEDVGLAFRGARATPGPIVLNLPTDLLGAIAVVGHRPPWSSPAEIRLAPSSLAVAMIAEMLTGAENPLLLAGRGALDAGDELARLAGTASAWVGTTLLARGLFRGHSNDLGVVGGFSSPAVRKVLAEVDVVVSYGASLNRFTTAGGKICPNARWVQVDIDPHAFGDIVPVEPVQADARMAAAAVRERLAAQPPPTRKRWAPQQNLLPGTSTGRPSTGIDPRVALQAVDAAVDAANLVVGIGHYSGFGALLIDVDDPRGLVLPWHLGSVGQALGIAAGVATATPDRLTVLVEGDGGLLMNPAELDTVARERLPVLIVVLDDAAYGAEVHLLRRFGLPEELATFPRRDLAALARALGLRAATAVTVDQLEPALESLRPFDGPSLLHVHSDREVVHEEIFSALQG